MKGIFINSAERTVSEVEVQNTLEAFYLLIGCDMIEVIPLGHGECLVVDEEGRLKPQEHFFSFHGSSQILCGNAVIVGSDSDGEFSHTALSVKQIRDKIEFQSSKDIEIPPPEFIFIPFNTR